jgi:hypothetical protein
MKIDDIVESIRNNRIRITDHADEEAQSDNLNYHEILFTVLQGEIIENYPVDTPYPSCLISGMTLGREPIHSVWAFNPDNKWSVLITVYRPDPNRWIDWKKRRK